MSKDEKPNEVEGIRLLTFNTWGLKFISKFRKERLMAIADRLCDSEKRDEEYDIIALQEVWCEEDWAYLKRKCCGIYPFTRRFSSGIITGPGLAILSKIPIESTFLYRFPINGRPSAFFRGDWYVGKSIAVTLFKPTKPGSKPLAILNSHMHAPYGQHGDRAYACHRSCQAWDISNVALILKRAGYAVALVGDLNSKPDSLPYKLFTIGAGLSDSWQVCHQGEKEYLRDHKQIGSLDPKDQITYGGITCDSQLNTWRQRRQRWEACRLDYALIDHSSIQPSEASVLFTERLPPPFNCSYSDHFAYCVKLTIRENKDLQRHEVHEKIAVIKELIAEIENYQQYTIPFQSRWREIHFVISIVCVIAILVGVAFASQVSNWSSVLLALSAVLITLSGVINGLIWYLGVRSELRALREVQMEAEDYLSSVEFTEKH